MNSLELPVNRQEVLYSRISKVNKTWIRSAAKKLGVSESAFVNAVLDEVRKKSARKKARPGASRK